MIGHMLIVYPILVFVGYLLGQTIQEPRWLHKANANGIPGVLIASFTLAFWMIPRWIDQSIGDTAFGLVKYLSLSMGVGTILAMSWQKLGTIARAVIKIEFLTMLFRLGWIYTISPERLCNNYLINEQALLGEALIATGIALSIIWGLPVFFGGADQRKATAIQLGSNEMRK